MPELNITYPISEKNPYGDPLPTQGEFHAYEGKYAMLAGGWGTGKTKALVLEMAKDIAIPNNYILLGRKDLQDLESTTLKEFYDVYGKAVYSTNQKKRIVSFSNGTEIYYTNLDSSRDCMNSVASLNLGAVYVDQCEEISEEMFLTLTKGRLRRENTRRVFRGGMNPNGHDWIWDRFHNKRLPNYKLFIASTLENIYLPPDYVEELLSMPPNWVKRYVYCSFDDFEGLAYNCYVEQLHRRPLYTPGAGEAKFIVVDYGLTNPTCVLFASVDYDGVVRIYDEYYQTDKLISEISAEIKERCPEYNFATLLIDPSTKGREKDGRSVWDEFLDNGLFFEPALNEVSAGINRVNEYFKNNLLFISDNCTNTLWEIGNYRMQDIKPGSMRNNPEKPIKKDDHAMDCLRYLINYVYTPVAIQQKAHESQRMLSRTNALTLADF